MTEETHNAAMSGSIGIIMAIGVSALLGWFLILGLLFSIQDLDATLNSSTGQPVTQIFLDTVGERGAIVLMVIVIGAMYFCGSVSIVHELGSARPYDLNFWLAQDVLNHLEFEDDVRICEGWWHPRTQVLCESQPPVEVAGQDWLVTLSLVWKKPDHGYLFLAVWLACTLSFILGLPSLGSSVAFAAATSIATIGLYISYGECKHHSLGIDSPNFSASGIPIALRVIYRDSFVRGPFHLRAFSYPVAIGAIAWILFISIAFILPQINVSRWVYFPLSYH